MQRRDRPALIEYAVFGAALALSLILAYHAYLRFGRKTAAVRTELGTFSRPAGSASFGVTEDSSSRRELTGSGTVSAVTVLPGAKGSPEAGLKRRSRR